MVVPSVPSALLTTLPLPSLAYIEPQAVRQRILTFCSPRLFFALVATSLRLPTVSAVGNGLKKKELVASEAMMGSRG